MEPELSEPFWKIKPLNRMTRQEWESLCDGCALCCLIKLEDEDSGDIYHTDVVCRLLDQQTCRCENYIERSVLVPGCLKLTPVLARRLSWLPETCAYRLLAEGKPLLEWHYLVSGDPEAVHRAGISVRGKAVSENDIQPDDLADHITDPSWKDMPF